MAIATLPSSHHLHFCFFSSLSSKFSITKQLCLNYPPKNRLSLVICSSSTSPPPPSSSSPQVSEPTPTAESCVNAGLELFSKGRVKDALVLFDTALTLNPNPVEAQAAFYNKACCHAYRGEGKKAAECLRTALKEYNLKFGTILNDPDLASFRALPEFKELQEEAKLGGEDIGYSFRRDLKLISEVQAPFRGVRRFFYVAFIAAAGISTFFTIPRLIRAIQGGDGAPDFGATAGNAAINVVGIVVLVALLFWDNKKEEEQLAQILRDETLSRLPLRLSTDRIVELVQLRDTVRPVSETTSLLLFLFSISRSWQKLSGKHHESFNFPFKTEKSCITFAGVTCLVLVATYSAQQIKYIVYFPCYPKKKPFPSHLHCRKDDKDRKVSSIFC